MRIKSPAFEENQPIPPIFACDGQNHNPPLELIDVPTNAQSLTLIMDDPDAPTGTFTHWMIWNIPPLTSNIEEKNVPLEAEEGLNSAGHKGYMGPCPPSGTHRYFFKLYALNKKLAISPNISKQELEREIDQALIEKAQFMGLYSKV